jgi:hypothetical protein
MNNVKCVTKKQISLLLDCYSQNVSTLHTLRESSNIKKIILCHFNLYSFNFGKRESIQDGTYAINFGEDHR